jgi:hypothetical protein
VINDDGGAASDLDRSGHYRSVHRWCADDGAIRIFPIHGGRRDWFYLARLCHHQPVPKFGDAYVRARETEYQREMRPKRGGHALKPSGKTLPTRNRKAIGRPKVFRYSPAIGNRICLQIATGANMTDIAATNGLPAKTLIYEWALDYPAFAEMYARARELRAHLKFDELSELAQTATGENYNAVRLQVDTWKWVLSKMLPRVYGDKLTTEIGLAQSLEQLVMDSIRLQQREAAKVIDHAPAREEAEVPSAEPSSESGENTRLPKPG